jgi:hypothetical protein
MSIICGNNHVAVAPDFDDREPETKYKPCYDCNNGVAVISYDDDGNAIEGECPACKGTGEIEYYEHD